MTHPLQAGATAESLSAENALLARAVIQMAELLRRVGDDPRFTVDVMLMFKREREAIEAAARVWPPKGE